MNKFDDEVRPLMDEYSERLQWLELAAGVRGRQKFENAKLYVAPYSGEYIDGILPTPHGYRCLIGLLDQLKDGLAIPLVDVDSYYAHDRRVPAGMRLEGNQLVDTWL